MLVWLYFKGIEILTDPTNFDIFFPSSFRDKCYVLDISTTFLCFNQVIFKPIIFYVLHIFQTTTTTGAAMKGKV